MTKDEMQKAIGQASYFNAAESPAWGREGARRAEFWKETTNKAVDSGMTIEQYEELYNSCNSGLTRFSEFGHRFKLEKERRENA